MNLIEFINFAQIYTLPFVYCMLVQEAAKGPLRWSSSQVASYITKKVKKASGQSDTKSENQINLSERIQNCIINLCLTLKHKHNLTYKLLQ